MNDDYDLDDTERNHPQATLIKVYYTGVPYSVLFIAFLPNPMETLQTPSYHLLHFKEDCGDYTACDYFAIMF